MLKTKFQCKIFNERSFHALVLFLAFCFSSKTLLLIIEYLIYPITHVLYWTIHCSMTLTFWFSNILVIVINSQCSMRCYSTTDISCVHLQRPFNSISLSISNNSMRAFNDLILWSILAVALSQVFNATYALTVLKSFFGAKPVPLDSDSNSNPFDAVLHALLML